jgi:hypothetical protein
MLDSFSMQQHSLAWRVKNLIALAKFTRGTMHEKVNLISNFY